MAIQSAAQALWRLAALGPCVLLVACTHPPGPTPGQPDRLERAADAVEPPARQRARLRLALATAYYQQGQYPVALDELRQALATEPDWVPALNLLGLVQLRMGQGALAEASLQRAVGLAPGDPDAAHNLGWVLCQQTQGDRHSESVALFERALAQPGYAQPAKTWAALGVCQQRAAKLDQAEASLRQALRLEPANTALAMLLAQVLAQRGQWQETSQLLSWVHAGQPANAQSLWLAARAAHKLDNPTLFRQWADQLKKEFGRSPQAQALDKGLFDE